MLSKVPRAWLLTAIRLLSLGALVFASALAVDYYFSSNTFCNEGAACDVVAKSEFGQRFGIFLPTIGFLCYSATFFGSFICANRRRLRFVMNICIILAALGALGFIFLQAAMINAFCWLCMGIDVCAILMTVPAILMLLNHKDESPISNKLSVLSWTGLYILFAGLPLSYGAFKPASVAVPQTAPPAIESLYKEGKINIVEISSFDCPHCKELHPQFKQLLKEYGDAINFKRITVPIGKNVNRDALISYYCAEMQEKPEEFADCMFEAPATDRSVLIGYAQKCNLDESSFTACLDSKAASNAVDMSLALVRDSGFKGAPTVWIDQISIVGFDRSKGLQPYRDAINQLAPKPYTPWPFYLCLGVGLLALILGLFLRRKKQTPQ